MLGKIPFPFSLIALLVALPAGWAYLAAATLRSNGWRRLLRVAAVTLAVVAPLATRGPGPVQLVLGLLAGYLGIRIVALGARPRAAPQAPGLLATALALTSVADLLRPARPDPARRPRRALALGVAGVAGCVALLWGGALLQLWRWSRYADGLLICLEVAIGTMGLNNLIIGAAAARGHAVIGLQERPALAASLAEFWAARWNHLVESNLDRGFFRPLCRRGRPALGVAATFLASGVMHVIPVLAAGPPAVTVRPAAAVLGFFLLHAALVLGERAVGLHRAPPAGPALRRARLRTVVLFALLSPMMLGPFADVCGVHGRALDAARPAPQNLSETPALP